MNFFKKSVLLILVMSLLQVGAFAQNEEGEREEQINRQITKIQKEIKRLEKKLEGISSPSRRIKIKELIAGHKARIGKLETEEEELLKAAFQEISGPAIQVTATPEVLPYIPEDSEEEPLPKEMDEGGAEKRFRFEIGGSTGFFAAATGAIGEIRIALPFVFGPATSTLRLAGGLAQSEDRNRRYAPLFIDGILNFPPGWFTDVENYFGAGLNYVVLTSGGKAGTIGGEIFYGVESTGFGGKLFGELGWGILRTGFSPSHRGFIILVGYRRDWGF